MTKTAATCATVHDPSEGVGSKRLIAEQLMTAKGCSRQTQLPVIAVGPVATVQDQCEEV